MPVDTSRTPQIQSEPLTVDPPAENGFLTRDAWLAQAGSLKEKTIEVDGLGKLLLVELTGAARAAIQSQQSTGLLADQRRIDAVSYQRALLLAGVADPTSPEGNRNPLFSNADMDRVMKIGGGKIAEVVDAIEELSALGAHMARAEENSEATPSAAGIS